MSHSFIFMFSFTVTLGGIKQLHASFYLFIYFLNAKLLLIEK